jgi:hypothetical protein
MTNKYETTERLRHIHSRMSQKRGKQELQMPVSSAETNIRVYEAVFPTAVDIEKHVSRPSKSKMKTLICWPLFQAPKDDQE